MASRSYIKVISKQAINTETDLQGLIEKLVSDGRLKPEILKDFEKESQKGLTLNDVIEIINGVFQDYLKQKELPDKKDLKFNLAFFLNYSKYPRASYLRNIKKISKQTIGEGMNLQELIKRLVLNSNLKLEIAEAFEKREHQEWTLDRVVETINGVYEDYLKQKEVSTKGDLKFSQEFFANYSNYPKASSLTHSVNVKAIIKNLIGKEKDLKGVIEYLADTGRIKNEILEAFEMSIDISKEDGFILQYAIENILKMVNNKNLQAEKLILGKRPDLIYESQEKVIIFDIKLQTTTRSINKDKRNYSKIISEGHYKNGDIFFLCLNGPDIKKEDLDINNVKIRVRYYHILDFLKRLADNKRNKFLMRIIAGNENEDISQIKDLNLEQINRINEIKGGLEVLQRLVSNNLYSTKNISLDEAERKTKEIKNKLRKLAKSKENNQEEILNTNFKELLDF